MKKIKIKLLQQHIKKAIATGTEIANLPDSNATKRSIKSMGSISLAQGSMVSDIEVIDTTSRKRIGLINNFIVVNKADNSEVENNNVAQGEYIVLPTINGLTQLQTILENYINQTNKEREVYFKIIATEGQVQEGENAPDDFSTASGVSQMSYVSGTTRSTYEESTIVTLHREEVESLKAEIQRLNAQIETITQNAASEKQLLETQIADLTRNHQILQSQKTTQDIEISNLNTQLSQKTQQITNINNQLTQKNTQVKNLTTQLNQANSQKQSLQNQVTQLQAQLQGNGTINHGNYTVQENGFAVECYTSVIDTLEQLLLALIIIIINLLLHQDGHDNLTKKT